MEEKKNNAPIDFAAIFKKLWPHRKTYYKVLPAVLIITYLITVCIPRYYTCTVKLAPEPTGPSVSGSLGSLASSFGFGSLSKMGNLDALNVEIYPDIIKSMDFVADLMLVQVTTKKGDIKTNYYTYLRDHQKDAWWNVIKARISEWIHPTPKDSYSGEEKLSVFNLTKQQSDIFNSVSGKIKCNVDKKTDVVSITVSDLDPLVCATIANMTCKKLQEFIIAYRTNKANIDYKYYKKLTAEAKSAYVKIRKQYVTLADANQDVTLPSYKAKEEDLEDEMQQKYNVYTAMNTQMQAAQAKLQEATPAFTIIESASVPIKPAGPKRLFISLGMMMLSFFILSGVLLVKKK
jgi:hypothetical protein